MTNGLPRVNEWELSDLNPGKQFLTDFDLSHGSYVRTAPLDEKEQKEVGEKGSQLAVLVMGIHGVNSVRISKGELRVYKLATHSWDELSPLIRDAFESVYGKIAFQKENPILLTWRRVKVILKS